MKGYVNESLNQYADNGNLKHQNEAPKESTALKHDFCKQMFINELSNTYRLRDKKEVKPTMVYFVVRIDGKQIKVSTGCKVYASQWRKKYATVEGVSALDRKNLL